MIRDADATRARLLEAATAEFAARGIAGARVDRIAAAAHSNKAQIYHYFGSKDALFDAVFGAYVERATADERFDAANLPEIAGRVHDDFEQHPELARLINWYRLERSDGDGAIREVVASNAAKVDAIRVAQDAGRLERRFPPEIMLALILTVATMWASIPPEFGLQATEYSPAARRAFIVDAVARLIG